MRILHVISTLDPATGGPPSVVSRLSSAQAALGHAVTVVSDVEPGREGAIAASLQTIPDIELVRLENLPPRPRGWLWPFAPRDRRRALLERLTADADVVHMHGVWESLLLAAASAARAHSVPYVV